MSDQWSTRVEEEERMVRDMAWKLPKNEAKPISDRLHREQTLSPQIRATLGETGVVMRVVVPAEYGSVGIGYDSYAFVLLFRNSVPYRAASLKASQWRVAGHPRVYRHPPGESGGPESSRRTRSSNHAKRRIGFGFRWNDGRGTEISHRICGAEYVAVAEDSWARVAKGSIVAARVREDSWAINGKKRLITNGIAHSIVRRLERWEDIESGLMAA